MYSDKWHVLGIEAYITADKIALNYHRVELIKYPEKKVFTYIIKKLCVFFSF